MAWFGMAWIVWGGFENALGWFGMAWGGLGWLEWLGKDWDSLGWLGVVWGWFAWVVWVVLGCLRWWFRVAWGASGWIGMLWGGLGWSYDETESLSIRQNRLHQEQISQSIPVSWMPQVVLFEKC